MAGGRPTKYDPAYCEQLVAHMEEGASVTSFAAEIDVCRATINVWAEEYPEFLEALSRGKAKCAAWWEKAGRTSAIAGTGNATMILFGLKNMSADDWREASQIDHRSTDGSMTPKPTRIIVEAANVIPEPE